MNKDTLAMLRSLKRELQLLHLSMVAQAEALGVRLDHLQQYIECVQDGLDRSTRHADWAIMTANEVRTANEQAQR